MEINEKMYTDAQLAEIVKARKYMNEQKVEIMLNPNFSAFQLAEIRKGLMVLPVEQVKRYAMPEITYEAMQLARKLMENPQENEQKITVYTTPGFDDLSFACFESGFKAVEERLVIKYAQPYFSRWQIYEIFRAFDDGLTEKEIDVFAKPEFDENQMRILRGALRRKKVPFDFIVEIAKLEYDAEELERRITRYKVEQNLHLELDPALSVEQLMMIDKLKEKYGSAYASVLNNPKFSREQMEYIVKAFNRFSYNELMLIANPEFSLMQMEIISRTIQKTAMEKQEGIKYMCNPKLSCEHMEIIRKCLYKSSLLTIEDIKEIASPKLSLNKVNELVERKRAERRKK